VGAGGTEKACSLPHGIRTGPVTSDVVASSRDPPHKRAHSTKAGTVTTTHGLPRRRAGKRSGWPVPSTCVAAQPPKPLNNRLQATTYSLRSYVAAASGSS